MKKFENLGKALGKQEQKKITGGALVKLWCYDGSSLVLNSTYSSFGACTGAFWGICTFPPYDYCYCTGDGQYFESFCYA